MLSLSSPLLNLTDMMPSFFPRGEKGGRSLRFRAKGKFWTWSQTDKLDHNIARRGESGGNGNAGFQCPKVNSARPPFLPCPGNPRRGRTSSVSMPQAGPLDNGCSGAAAVVVEPGGAALCLDGALLSFWFLLVCSGGAGKCVLCADASSFVPKLYVRESSHVQKSASPYPQWGFPFFSFLPTHA
jgi:hypothetical protein